MVGGAVRDALLRLAPLDLDWLVADPANAALKLTDALGGSAVLMDASRHHWRVVLPGGEVHDFAPPRVRKATPGTLAPVRQLTDDLIEGDLLGRDITFNALALTPEGQLLDPLGGVQDLTNGVVRMTSRAALFEDPLRPLRVVRFAAALGFRVSEETLETTRDVASAQAASELRLPALERVGAELGALMSTAKAAQAFQLLGELGYLRLYLPELEATRGVHQGRGFHHLDVLGHSLEALNQLLLGFPDAVPELRWATLLHDVGKPASREVGPLGRVTFHGHDAAGAELARVALKRLRFSSAFVTHVTKLVRYHMLPLPEGERSARRFVHKRRELLPDLLKLMIADREAARGPLSSEAGRRRYREALGQVVALLQEPPPLKPLLSGVEVMELLGLTPGPRVGEALSLVSEARAVGDVHDAADARALLKRYAHAQGWSE